MIVIPALNYKSKSYPSEFQSRVPKRIRFLPPAITDKEWEVCTDSDDNVSIILNWGAGTIVPVKHPFEVTEWYYSGSHSQCEWNPRGNCPSHFLLGKYHSPRPTDGCQNEAVLSIGYNEKWHLCEECAKLPKFKRFTVRKRLRNDQNRMG